jgi:hypothetical protein
LSTISFFVKSMNASNPFIYSLERRGHTSNFDPTMTSIYIYNMALYEVRILPNINKKLQMMRKSCVG